jgi:hypothetical protein
MLRIERFPTRSPEWLGPAPRCLVAIVKGVVKADVSINRTRTFFDSPGVTEPDTRVPRSPPARPTRPRTSGRSSAAFCSAGTSPSTRRPHSSPPPSAPQFQAGHHAGRRVGTQVFPPPVSSRCSDNGSRRSGPARHGTLADYSILGLYVLASEQLLDMTRDSACPERHRGPGGGIYQTSQDHGLRISRSGTDSHPDRAAGHGPATHYEGHVPWLHMRWLYR